jgi:hypothetical protein
MATRRKPAAGKQARKPKAGRTRVDDLEVGDRDVTGRR